MNIRGDRIESEKGVKRPTEDGGCESGDYGESGSNEHWRSNDLGNPKRVDSRTNW